ncbi:MULTISPECIES: FimV family protein [Bordetella]|uniref:Peptidoglycan-binding protein LysM n=1 Tax=Bordetella genomosp. 2 TaxID=1983456 RepID=A0A261VRN9_9BORD|nr:MULTISPECIES: FimV/HubP family polar landmark protein [Bordetella]OZI76250.1 peptidoglycan-binding protein LysM [Bordetella genomosp. 2]
MTLRSRHSLHAPRTKALQWAVALALGASLGTVAQAASVGHSRVVSAPGAPLQVVVPLQGLSPEEVASLQVSLADPAAWQRAGLNPPVPLDSVQVSIQDGADAARKNIRIVSTQPLATQAVDLLLDVRSSAGHRQVQVTILVPPRGAGADVQPARVGSGAAASGASAGAVTVRQGDNLFRIARRNAVPDASVYQMLVALWRANPQAFIQNNMNLVRAGETLSIPDAATVRAIDPAEARRIFAEQVAAFERYRGRAGADAAAGAAVAGAGGAAAGQVSQGGPSEPGVSSTPQDRLRLSATSSADAQADARTSSERAMQDAQQRVDTLQGNVDALSQAAGGKGGQAGATAGGAAGAAATGAGAGQAGTQASGAAGDSGASGQSGSPGTADAGSSNGAQTGAGASNGAQAGAAEGAAAGANAHQGAAPAGGNDAAASANGTGAASGSAAAPGAAGVNGAAGTSGSGTTAAAPGAGAAGAGAPGAAGAPAAAGGQDQAGQGKAAADPAREASASSMPGWLADNLLVIVTAALAFIVLVIAWLLRRAGARRADEDEASYGEPVLDTAALNRKLDGINLDLDQPPSDEPPAGRPRA